MAKKPTNTRTIVQSISFKKHLWRKLSDENLIDQTDEVFGITSRSGLVNAAVKEWFDNHTHIHPETGELIVNGYDISYAEANKSNKEDQNPYH